MNISDILKLENPELYDKLESLCLIGEVVSTIEMIILKHGFTKEDVLKAFIDGQNNANCSIGHSPIGDYIHKDYEQTPNEYFTQTFPDKLI